MSRIEVDGRYIKTFFTLSGEGAQAIAKASLLAAQELGVYGYLVVASREDLVLVSRAEGDLARPFHDQMARVKKNAVLAMRRSTRRIGEWLKYDDFDLEDFAGLIATSLPGGVAVFADSILEVFIGAVAFSGGSPVEDEYICLRGVSSIKAFSDISLLESEERLRGK